MLVTKKYFFSLMLYGLLSVAVAYGKNQLMLLKAQ
jgi:hypothetical protein